MAEESEVQPVNKTYNTIEPEVNMPSGKFWTILEFWEGTSNSYL